MTSASRRSPNGARATSRSTPRRSSRRPRCPAKNRAITTRPRSTTWTPAAIRSTLPRLRPPASKATRSRPSETDAHGNVVRELGARARLEALEAEDPAARSHELDTHSSYTYEEDGTRMLDSESWGPLHEVRLEDGETVEARQHTRWNMTRASNTKKAKPGPTCRPPKRPAQSIPGQRRRSGTRVTKTTTTGALRKPTEEIVDPEGLDLVTKTAYNSAGQVKEERQPSDSSGGGAGTTKTVYWTAHANPEDSCAMSSRPGPACPA